MAPDDGHPVLGPFTIRNQWKQLVSMLDERYGLYAPVESHLHITFLNTGRLPITFIPQCSLLEDIWIGPSG
jgi:hypothetical protein